MMSDVHHDSVGGSEAGFPSCFSFKLQDRRGRMHRFSCGMLLPTFAASPSELVYLSMCSVMLQYCRISDTVTEICAACLQRSRA